MEKIYTVTHHTDIASGGGGIEEVKLFSSLPAAKKFVETAAKKIADQWNTTVESGTEDEKEWRQVEYSDVYEIFEIRTLMIEK